MSTANYAPAEVLEGPLPQPRPYGFSSVAVLISDEDEHWAAGAQIHSYPPDLPESHWQCAAQADPTGDNAKVEGGAIPLPTFGAFPVYLAETCTSRAIRNDSEFRDRAKLTLDATEDFAVERELSQGTQMGAAGNPFLSDANATALNAAAATGSVEALALLEDAIGGDTGRAGVIHATPGIVTLWSSLWLVFEKNGRLVTANGTPVISGAGYIGAVVGGGVPTADQAWAFATGPVYYRRGSEIFMIPEQLKEALDRDNNRVTYRAERYYMYYWDTALQEAVLVDRSI